MTINELIVVLQKACNDGHGHTKIVFDSEAREFNYHYVDIDHATLDDGKDTGFEPMLILFTKFH